MFERLNRERDGNLYFARVVWFLREVLGGTLSKTKVAV